MSYHARVDLRKNCLLPPDSSITSTRPGFSCSMEGTWLARTPISPDSAGMLTWTLPVCQSSTLFLRVLEIEHIHILRLVDGLRTLVSTDSAIPTLLPSRDLFPRFPVPAIVVLSVQQVRTYLVRQGQSQLNLVRCNIGVRAPHERSGLESGWANAKSASGDTEGVHGRYVIACEVVRGSPMLAALK